MLAQVNHPTLVFENKFTGFSEPVDIANAGDGSNRIFIVERAGFIKIIKNGVILSTPFLDIDSIVRSNGQEQGLLGLAFHPNYNSNGYFYVNYIDEDGDTQISRYNVSVGNDDVADATSEFPILNVDQIDGEGNHNGGCIKFGPDGYLYIAMGDGGGGGDPDENGQDGTTLLGKMLRIDINSGNPYSIPSDNPFVDNAGVLNEIWALGLRNPWRFSFDSETGDMWIADVGQGVWEEVNFQPADSDGGENYGWDCYEGNNTYETTGCLGSGAYTFPIFDYNQSGSQSITGGLVYRGNSTCLRGFYICTDYISEKVWTIAPDGSGGWSVQEHNPSGINAIVAFGTSESGDVYAVSLWGNIFQIGSEDDTVSGDPIVEGSYYTPGVLFSDGRIATGDQINLSAGEAVQLQSDFQIDPGGQLNTTVGCQ